MLNILPGKGIPDGIGSTMKLAFKAVIRFNPDIPVYNVEDVLNHINVSSINIFPLTKNDVTKKKKTAPTDLLEVKGTAKCHEVSICHETGIKLMKNTSDQPGKPFVFSMKDTTRGKRGKSQANGNNNNEIATDYEEEDELEEDELMEEEEEITEDDNKFLVMEDEDENYEVEDDSEDDVERDEEEDEDHQDRYEQYEAKEANEEEKPVGNEDQYLEKPKTFTIGDYVQVTKGKYCGMYATVLCVVDNSEVQIQYFEKKPTNGRFRSLVISTPFMLDARSHLYFQS